MGDVLLLVDGFWEARGLIIQNEAENYFMELKLKA
jgi:hypothetical protein